MFKTRLFTTIAIVFVLGLILALGYPYLQLFVIAVFTVANIEWLNFIKLSKWQKFCFSLFFITILISSYKNILHVAYPITIAAVCLWSVAIVLVSRYQTKTKYNKYLIICMSFIYLLPAALLTLVFVSDLYLQKIFLLIVAMIATTDVAAYIFGRLFGKSKMCPKISPKKTWEGLVLGVSTALLVAYHFSYLVAIPTFQFMLLAFATIMFSVYGDLFISVQKRMCKVKDSGKILPGHGGILDRVDSLIAGLPLFSLGLITYNILILKA